MTGKDNSAVGNKNALDLFQNAAVDDLLVSLVTPGAAGFSSVFASRLIVSTRAAYLHSVHESAVFTGRIPFRGPAEEYGPGGLVDEDLENAIGGILRWGHESLQAVKESSCVIGGHRRGATPVGPLSFIELIIVRLALVDNSMQEAQNNVVRDPINNDVACDIMFIDSDYVCVRKGIRSVATENRPDSRQPCISHASNTSMQRPTVQYIPEVGTRRVLFVGMNIVQQTRAYESSGLVSHVHITGRVQIQVAQLRVEQTPIAPCLAIGMNWILLHCQSLTLFEHRIKRGLHRGDVDDVELEALNASKKQLPGA